MSRKVLYIILYMCMLFIPIYGQQDNDWVSDSIVNAYDKAQTMNRTKNYIEAYSHICLAEKIMDTSMSKNNLHASVLNDDDFEYPYWRIKQSKAEIAYMLGIYTDMAVTSYELRLAINEKKWKDDNLERRKNLQASLEKIDGSRYFLTEQYDSSEIALNKALRLSKEYWDYDFDFYYALRGDLAQLYYKKELYKKALAQLDSVLVHVKFQTGSRLSPLDLIQERKREVLSQRAICLARLGRYAEALKEIDPICSYYKKTDEKRLYAEALRKKAKILMLQYDSTGKYDPVAKNCYQEYLTVSRKFIDHHFVQMSESEREQYWMAEQPFVTDCFRLEDKAPELLYDVALYSKAVLLQMGRDFKEGMTIANRKAALTSIRINWQEIKDELPTSGCAIEFVVYEKKGVNHIGALAITKKSSSPRFIDLGEVTKFADYQLANELRVKDVFADTQDRDKINTLYNDTTLRQLVWNDELVSCIGSNMDVYFSPDGIFHQMGIEYMTPQSLEEKRFYRLTTTRLLTQAKHTFQTDKMLICGGVEYGLSEEDNGKENDELAYSLLASMDLNITPLPNSSVEIDSIIAVRKNHTEDFVLRADSLTEAALTQLMGRYHIVHISTHGLFSEVSKIGTDIHPALTDLQLSKSCLFLSGSEKNLKHKEFDASQHDGILSARELSKMDLDGVDLTVMSACMSGLGYITPDGVYGLQRGLKTAGVKAIISTLWSVDDEASCFFIIQLYKSLETGLPVHEAFATAREALKKHEKTYGNSSSDTNDVNGSYTQRRRITIPKFNKPYFYNAFILIDGLE